MRNKIIHKTCIACNKSYDLAVNSEDLERYEQGEYAQNAFPYLASSERELIISGLCGDCFNDLFETGD
ncbi:hypothetical protein D3H64_06155 [Atopobacter sp. AH10]|uniref:hypothetical protein n=1 Tax=Atopobacter sp. AH10 TaxID=2315861 RepID=UPI000EF1B421|nr:hypothetical protein [Atopobacter sp. AH10]RLK63172.1 hypothetical protein D3H64_06155 [Atopobacter sp. AH10]